MPSLTWIISLALLIVTFFAILFVAKLSTKSIDEQQFSFLRIFPFESAKYSAKNGKIYLYLCYLFSGVNFASFLVLLEGTNKLEALNGLSIVILILLCLSSIAFVFLNIFDVTHVKAHLSLFTIFVFLILLSGALSFVRALVSYKTCLRYGSKENLLLVCQILNALVCLLTLVVAFNPKLRYWAKLDLVEGTTNKYVRPKKFVLAYSEWSLFILMFCNVVLYYVQLLVK